jgi:HPt (histidine-containing phosphotransfer) domain-containing protein
MLPDHAVLAEEGIVVASVNFEILHTITGNDSVVEAELLDVFLVSMEESIAGLRDAYHKGENSAWKGYAHAMKGVAMNLGAEQLGEMCRHAQEFFMAPHDEKTSMLQSVEGELMRVCDEVEQRLSLCRRQS